MIDLNISVLQNLLNFIKKKQEMKALKKATGGFIAFLDCDDWWEPNHLENAKDFLKNEKYKLYFLMLSNYLEKKKNLFSIEKIFLKIISLKT